ncbi:MAG: arylesterase [Gemmatimonadetes bacterium]|nr:MAG: arylesterase [Gemmatimonadota bacterium]
MGRTFLLCVLSLAATACAGDSSEGVPRGTEQDPRAASSAAADDSVAGRTEGAPEPRERDPRARVVFLGTSLTAGYGLPDPAHQAYPALLQARIDSAGWPFRVVDAGVSGDTSAGGLARLGALLAAPEPLAVLVIELGANDGLRGLPVNRLRANLDLAVTRTLAAHPDARIVVVGMEAPPNLGPDYVEAFRKVFPEVAARHGASLVPFLLDGVAGVPELNQEDGIHPTVEGHRRLADNLWRVLAPLLDSIRSRGAPTAATGGAR